MEKITLPGFSPYYGPTTGFSRAFQTFMKDIGDAKSKYEEDRIISKEIHYLKTLLAKPNIQPKQMKENLIRMIYFEMLGHDASFGIIHAVNWTQKGNLMDKRLGYLACCLLLHENHELTLLVMNTIQKDLKSSNIMENCIALIAATRLVNKDMIPAIFPLVLNLMHHNRDIVRKKAVMTLFWFYRLDPSSLENTDFEQRLCDRSPSVMGATLNVYLGLIKDSRDKFRRLTPTFVNILKQVIEFRLSNEFTYYNIPGPWIQIKLLKILSFLGHEDEKATSNMCEVLKLCLETTQTESNIGCAVLFECLRTSMAIAPNKALTELASRKVRLLLVSKNNNLKYLGINILADLIDVDVSYASKHQMTVIECLNDPDETLKRKTLLLLYRMTNSTNVTVICDKMIDYLRSSVDEYARSDLVNRITALAEKFAPDNEWFIKTMNTVFECGGTLVRPQVAHNLMMLIGEGTDDEDLDNELRLHAVDSYLDLIDKESIPDILIQVVCWVIGEYSYLAAHCDPEDVLGKLCLLFKRYSADNPLNAWIVSAITKICAQIGYLPDSTKEELEKLLRATSNMETEQRCAELFCLLDTFESLDEILPPDASSEDLEVDSTLSFLDGFVADALSRGAAPYKPEHMQDASTSHTFTTAAGKHEPTLNFTPYPEYKPRKVAKKNTFDAPIVTESRIPGLNSSIGGMILPTDPSSQAVLNTQKSAKVVWGLSGYLGNKDRDTPSDHISDSSSTHSGADSGSFASVTDPGVTNQKPDESSKENTPSEPSTHRSSDNEKLAEQLFRPASGPHGDRLRPEKAGFSRRRPDKRPREPKPVYEARNMKEPALLLDLEDTGTVDSSQPQITDTSDKMERYETDLLDSLYEQIPEMTLSENLSVKDNGWDEYDKSQPLTGGGEGVTPTGVGEIDNQGDQLAPEEINNDVIIQENHSVQQNQRKDHEDLLASIEPVAVDAPEQLPVRSVPTLPADLQDSPNSEIEIVAEDTNVKLSFQKVFLQDCLAVVFYVINQRPAALTDVFLFLQPPSNVSTMLDGVSDTTSSDDLINNYEYSRHILSLKFRSPSLNMLIGGHMSYKDTSNTQKRLFISLPLAIFDFIRPLRIDTRTYGKMWGGTAYEKKYQVRRNEKSSIDEICELVQRKFGFHVVEIIGSEAITAGGISSEHCLLHFKCSDIVLDLRLKTGSNLLNDCILQAISKSL